MAHDLGTDPDQPLAQRDQGPILNLVGWLQCLLLMQWTAPTRRHLGAKMVVIMNHREIGAAL